MALLVAALPARADAWWGPDKALHLGVSVGLAATATAVTAAWIDAPLDRAIIGALGAFSLGLAKEVADGLGLGTPSLRDLAWDLVGCVVGAALVYVVERLFVAPLLEALAPRFAG